MATRLRMGEAAQRLGLSQETVREWVRRGFLKARRTPTGHLLFDEADVDAARRGEHPSVLAPTTREAPLSEVGPDEPKQTPTWKKLPPWVTKVETARAGLTLDELEAERKDRAKERQSERQREIAAEQRAAQEKALQQRLNSVKKRVIQTVWIPSQFRSEVITSVERFATLEQLPSWLAEWEQFDLVAAHARALVQKLLQEEQRAFVEERTKEEKRIQAEREQQSQEFAAKFAEALKPKDPPPVPSPRSVAEALRRRGVTDS